MVLGSLDFNRRALRVIGDETGELKAHGKGMNEGPKTHPLDEAFDPEVSPYLSGNHGLTCVRIGGFAPAVHSRGSLSHP